ncbi:MAG: ABC transporter ATP-binding protein [Planctomycetota bacterium]
MSFVTIKNCRKAYVGKGTAADPTIEFCLDELTVEKEQQVALVGPSGCGKTTLLNLISGIVAPDAGEIQVGAARLDRLSGRAMDRFRGATIGYIFQGFNLIQPLNALQNMLVALRFGRAVRGRERGARAVEMLDRVGLSHRLKHYPFELSMGEQQRLAIARALANKPPLILADEPTASLDARNAAEVLTLLREVCPEGSHTLLIVTHDSNIAAQFPDQFDCSNLIREGKAAE